ncbi:MAG: NUDIX hydrolase [Myxococcota bacterium]
MDETILYAGRFLRAVRRGHWEYVSRQSSSGVVVLVATTPAGELVLVEQYRAPVDRRVIELPAGLAGDIAGQEDEPLTRAAARELEEETGWRAGRIEALVSGPVSAGLTTEVISFFRASELTRIGPGGGDEHEDIEVHHVPLGEVASWLAARTTTGVMVDPKVYAALYFTSLDRS